MAKITLHGCDPYDGEYPFNLDEQAFTTGELNIIKQVAGVRGGELGEATEAGDTDLIVAFAVIALARAGKVTRRQALTVAERLWESPLGSLEFDANDGDADADPPASPPVSGGADESSENGSGNDSSIGSENPA